MSATVQTKNRFTDEALLHAAAIETASAEYEIAKKRDAESKAQLERAKLEAASLLNDRDADLATCIEGLVVADARVKILEHRLSAGADNSVSERLLELVQCPRNNIAY